MSELLQTSLYNAIETLLVSMGKKKKDIRGDVRSYDDALLQIYVTAREVQRLRTRNKMLLSENEMLRQLDLFKG
jgi:hypothetical protein